MKLDPHHALLNGRELAAPKLLNQRIRNQLSLRLDITVEAASKLIPAKLRVFGKCQRLEGGDTMHAAVVFPPRAADRDMTYVKVCRSFDKPTQPLLTTFPCIQYVLRVDKNAKRGKNTRSIFVDRTFYGQIQYFIAIDPVPENPNEPASPHNSGSFLFAAILPCQLLGHKETDNFSLPCYRQFGALEVVDIKTIEGLVGRVHDRHRSFWVLIEREGEFRRLSSTDDQDDEAS